MDSISERVKALVVKHLGVDPSKVNEGTRIVDDLGADSLDSVELIMSCEEEFGLEIPDNLDDIITVQDIIDLVEKGIDKSS